MKASELRIGNVIDFEDGSTDRVKVTGISQEDSMWFVDWERISGNGSYDEGTSILDDFKPVVLASEILEKAGFVLTNDGVSPYWRLVIMRTEVISIEDDWSFGLNAENESSSQGYSAGPDLCKYVHQLQNLYFALTGQELTLSL